MFTNEQSEADIFAYLGQTFTIKVARLAAESVCYGTSSVIDHFSLWYQSKHSSLVRSTPYPYERLDNTFHVCQCILLFRYSDCIY